VVRWWEKRSERETGLEATVSYLIVDNCATSTARARQRRAGMEGMKRGVRREEEEEKSKKRKESVKGGGEAQR
jgi:hypothetical protein